MNNEDIKKAVANLIEIRDQAFHNVQGRLLPAVTTKQEAGEDVSTALLNNLHRQSALTKAADFLAYGLACGVDVAQIMTDLGYTLIPVTPGRPADAEHTSLDDELAQLTTSN